MPYCHVAARRGRKGKPDESEAVKIFYRTYGQGSCKVLMIMAGFLNFVHARTRKRDTVFLPPVDAGVAATNTAWWPQVKPLTGTDVPNEADEDDEEAGEEGRNAPEQDSSEERQENMRAKSDLGHRLMVHGAETLSHTHSSPPAAQAGAGQGSPGSGIDMISGASGTSSLFEKLDSDTSSGAESGREGSTGAQGKSSQGTGEAASTGLTGRVVCVFDNRGVGRSSHPVSSKNYRTEIMAADALALADKLGWERFHVIGHSMGGMIACKLASAAPSRILSMALISTSNGGFDCFPRMEYRTFRLVARMLQAKEPEERAAVDLDTHFSENFLDELTEGQPRRQHLHKEYVRTLTSKGAMQPRHAQNGQLSACWHHGLTSEETRRISHADIPTSVIHGSDDIVAHVSLGRRMAKRLHAVARFVELYGGHMIIRERVEQVNNSLIELVTAAEQGIRGRAWATSDEHREEADAKLQRCDSECGDCPLCLGPAPMWEELLSA